MPTATFIATIDSLMDKQQPDTNYGASGYVVHDARYIGGEKSTLRRAIGNFDVSSLAGETILAARLRRKRVFTVGAPYNLRLSRCTRPATWTEGGVTWNKYDGTNLWTAGGGDVDDVGPPAKIEWSDPTGFTWHTLSGLEGFVTDALADRDGIVSIIIRLVTENPGSSTGASVFSKDSGGDEWHLEVDYGSIARRTHRRSLLGVS